MRGRSVLLAVMVMLSIMAVPIASAVDYTADYSDADEVHVSEDIDVHEDLLGVYADVETVETIAPDDDTVSSTDVRFVVAGINETTGPAANSTELVNETRTIQQGSLESFTYEPTDSEAAEYNSLYLHVESVTASESDRINSTNFGTTVYSPGAGGGLGGSVAGVGLPVIAALLVVGYILVRD